MEVARVAPQGAAGALLAGTRWVSPGGSATIVTYSFDNAQSRYPAAFSDFAASAQPFSEADKAVARQLLAAIEAVCNVRFVEVADDGTQAGAVRYGYSDRPQALGLGGFGTYPAGEGEGGGQVWLAANLRAAAWDYYRPFLMLHETLHALGLQHPFQGPAPMARADDVIPNTVMSYLPAAGQPLGVLTSYPLEPMLADVAALQALYGAAVHNAGDTVYDVSQAGYRSFRVIWDSAGNDCIDASRCAQAVTIDLTPGSRSDIGQTVRVLTGVGRGGLMAEYHDTLAIAQGCVIEAARGSAFDDTFRVPPGAAVHVDGGAGHDRVLLLGSFDGSAVMALDLASVEQLVFAEASANLVEAARIVRTVWGDAGLASLALLAEVDAQLAHAQPAEVVAALAHDRNTPLGSAAGTLEVVSLLWDNVTGGAPRPSELSALAAAIDRYDIGTAELALYAAHHPLNTTAVEAVGITPQTVPFS